MLIFNFNLMYNCSMNVFLVSSFSWVNKCFLFYSILFYTPLSHRPTRGPKFAWGRASPGPFCVGRAGGRHLRGDCVGTARLQREFVPSVDMAKCVGIETGYIKIKMRGDYKYTSKWVGIAWGLRGDEKMINTLCGDGVGLPTQGFVELGAPHTIPT